MMAFAALFFVLVAVARVEGTIYPQHSPTREFRLLDGPWNFRLPPKNDPNAGEREKWYNCIDQEGKGFSDKSEVFIMPVPASFNDITTSAKVRDFVGVAWYQRHFHLSSGWLDPKGNKRMSIRFGGVNYKASVWLNGAKIADHEGGHLPFEADISNFWSSSNCLTVAVNNTLYNHSIPQGEIISHPNDTDRYPVDYVANTYTFDFFNYAGIHRPVHLLLLPSIRIQELSVQTTKMSRIGADFGHAVLNFQIDLYGAQLGEPFECLVVVLDADGHAKGSIQVAAQQQMCQGVVEVRSAKLWWPSGSRPDPGYRHTVQVKLFNSQEQLVDFYQLPFGIRTVTWDKNNLYINHEPFYLKGIGRHEDSDIRGKGFDLPLAIKDHNLMQWLGVNGYRTSHYPYAEESLDISEQYGLVVISESPAVNLVYFDDQLLEKHKKVMAELISRDKNRACVIMWSLSNEARSFQPTAKKYYKELAEYVKKLDSSRPVTMVTNVDYKKDLGAPFMDILAINRYFSWYSDSGSLQVVRKQMEEEVSKWRATYGKPVIVSEYGADAIAGYHSDPPVIWTEDYQVELLRQNFKAFNDLRRNGNLTGEMVWNFADFQTAQGYKRANGNKKGIFTRDRKPKAAAHTLKHHYNSIP